MVPWGPVMESDLASLTAASDHSSFFGTAISALSFFKGLDPGEEGVVVF